MHIFPTNSLTLDYHCNIVNYNDNANDVVSLKSSRDIITRISKYYFHCGSGAILDVCHPLHELITRQS